eukprot:TRINITY_DN67198_c0_g1_i1.p1 TRINITY_DN67198_c0_g1~~TRINITY_DN67198_c0_g1_i1.p1  ORF type:complete len:1031 (-),score=172.61 TRINITY_DN67198_c0_g1_i1:35-3091(-)
MEDLGLRSYTAVASHGWDYGCSEPSPPPRRRRRDQPCIPGCAKSANCFAPLHSNHGCHYSSLGVAPPFWREIRGADVAFAAAPSGVALVTDRKCQWQRPRWHRRPHRLWLLILTGCCAAAAALPAGLLEAGVVLSPTEPYHVRSLEAGRARFLRFTCNGPADAVLWLTAAPALIADIASSEDVVFSEAAALAARADADPMLLISVDPEEAPSVTKHHDASLEQWKEGDFAGGIAYVIAKLMGPDGGIVGIVNTGTFGHKELEGVLHIRCAAMEGFDTMFSSVAFNEPVCPVGFIDGAILDGSGSVTFCGGHGLCDEEDRCVCSRGFVGRVCEHRQRDVVAQSIVHEVVKIPVGRFHFFRVRVPRRFSGGVLSVVVSANLPLGVLIRRDKLPTKHAYDLSNFDDFVLQRNVTALRYEVFGAGIAPWVETAEARRKKRRRKKGDELRMHRVDKEECVEVLVTPAEEREARTFASLEPGTCAAEGFESPAGGREETLHFLGRVEARIFKRVSAAPLAVPLVDEGVPTLASCPSEDTLNFSGPLCRERESDSCTKSCQICLKCASELSRDSEHCHLMCRVCVGTPCETIFSHCAASASCSGQAASQCEATCAGCLISCLDPKSNDKACAGCHCCSSCLPAASKCGFLRPGVGDYTSYINVGIYNHHRYGKEATASVHLDLEAGPNLVPATVSSSGGVDDPFVDVSSIAAAQHMIDRLGDGTQFLYQLRVPAWNATSEDGVLRGMRLHWDGLTLLRLDASSPGDGIDLNFTRGSSGSSARTARETNVSSLIGGVYSTSTSAPKSFFDLEKVHVVDRKQPEGRLHGDAMFVHLEAAPTASRVWCVIVGSADGTIDVEARARRNRGRGEVGSATEPLDHARLSATLRIMLAILVSAAAMVIAPWVVESCREKKIVRSKEGGGNWLLVSSPKTGAGYGGVSGGDGNVTNSAGAAQTLRSQQRPRLAARLVRLGQRLVGWRPRWRTGQREGDSFLSICRGFRDEGAEDKMAEEVYLRTHGMDDGDGL